MVEIVGWRTGDPVPEIAFTFPTREPEIFEDRHCGVTVFDPPPFPAQDIIIAYDVTDSNSRSRWICGKRKGTKINQCPTHILMHELAHAEDVVLESIRNTDVRTVEEIEPKTQILSESEILYEETVSRAGTQVTTHYQRTRGPDGSTYLSLVRKVGPGKGEGSSGLMFDIIDDKKKDLQKA